MPNPRRQAIFDPRHADFRAYWQAHFPTCPPVSYLFKLRLSERWFRIHSLPESKRYPDNATEMAMLLARQNALLSDVIGVGQPCALILGDYGRGVMNADPDVVAFKPRVVWHLPKHDYDPVNSDDVAPPLTLTLSVAALRWQPGALDALLRRVAEEQRAHAFVMRLDGARLFAPYDGGADVVLRDSAERDAFKTRYCEWLSQTPSGY
jgi:hypothetical protein